MTIWKGRQGDVLRLMEEIEILGRRPVGRPRIWKGTEQYGSVRYRGGISTEGIEQHVHLPLTLWPEVQILGKLLR